MTEESEHTAGQNGTGGGAVAAACSLLYLSSSTPPPSLSSGRLADRSRRAPLPAVDTRAAAAVITAPARLQARCSPVAPVIFHLLLFLVSSVIVCRQNCHYAGHRKFLFLGGSYVRPRGWI